MNFWEKFSVYFEGLFKSQDSKFFLMTGFKVTAVQIFSFSVMFYSLWTIVEMNYTFFVSNGFLNSPELKEAFFDKVFLNINHYFYYFGLLTIGVFTAGLIISWFALRPFDHIVEQCLDIEDDEEEEFDVGAMASRKLIYKAANLFFDFIGTAKNKENVSNFPIPEEIEKIKKPKVDPVFLFQYFTIILIVTIGTSFALYTFANSLYIEIVDVGLELLRGNEVVSKFMSHQHDVLYNVYLFTITINVALYMALSRNVLKIVDGVCYAFARDIRALIKGEIVTLRCPRAADPGKEAALAINDLFKFVFGEDVSPAPIDSPIHHEFGNHELTSNLVNLIELKAPTPLKPKEDELPPVFVDEKKVVGGDSSFNVITSKGHKVENLDEGQVFKLIKELEDKS